MLCKCMHACSNIHEVLSVLSMPMGHLPIYPGYEVAMAEEEEEGGLLALLEVS